MKCELCAFRSEEGFFLYSIGSISVVLSGRVCWVVFCTFGSGFIACSFCFWGLGVL